MYDDFFLVVIFVLFVVPWISGYFTVKAHWDCKSVSTFHLLLHTVFFCGNLIWCGFQWCLDVISMCRYGDNSFCCGYHLSTSQFYQFRPCYCMFLWWWHLLLVLSTISFFRMLWCHQWFCSLWYIVSDYNITLGCKKCLSYTLPLKYIWQITKRVSSYCLSCSLSLIFLQNIHRHQWSNSWVLRLTTHPWL